MSKQKTHDQYVIELNNTNPNLETLERYINGSTPIMHKCKICDYKWPIRPRNVLHGDGCPNCSKRRKRKHIEYVEEVAQLNPNIEVIGTYVNRHTKILHKCKIDGYEWNPDPGRILSGGGCPVCSHRTIGKNFENSIWTSEYRDLFAKYMTEEQMKQIMPNSGKKTTMICPDCGKQKLISPNNLFQTHNLGCECSDNISYPNKFIYAMLNQLDIAYIPECIFEWSDKKRYDIYIPSLNCIIENHGIQHYENSFSSAGGKTLEEEQANDTYKRNMALKNGIFNYIVLDCRQSDMDWIQNSVKCSLLSQFFDLSAINWDKCNEFACSNLVKTAAKLWNNGLGVYKIVNEMHLSDATVVRYLKRANKCGLCDYTKENSYKRMGESNRGSNHHMARIAIQLTNELQIIRLWKCMTDAELELHINMKQISRCCYDHKRTAGGYLWRFLYDQQKKDGTIIPGAITLGLITEKDAIQQLNNPT